ncbi:MAG TPA: RNA polymerase sigma factor [Saprospiraceae bacterium]|nr:RNA polymerase sigma factor [Saprospiraceae bacterium]HMP23589.1 RNA polymerase sigma factor [Saprospiraceae bacterium]
MKDLEVINSYLETQASMCFSVLYSRYASKIYGKCLTILKDEAMAEDATQEIFMKIFLNLSRFEEKARFSTWIYSITYNYCIDYLRRKQKQSNVFSDDEIEKAADVAEDDVSDAALMELEVRQLRNILDEMPPGDRTILLMKYQDDMSIREIAGILNKSESAVKMKIKRAKEKAQKLKEEFLPTIR